MKINRIEVSCLANKRTYLYNELFSLAREHKCFYSSEFGNDFITINKPTETFIEKLKKLGIKFRGERC